MIDQEAHEHRIFITEHTEYHMSGPTCIAVRRLNGELVDQHQAIGATLEGAIGMKPGGGYVTADREHVDVGQRLCFTGDLMTSPLQRVRRPSPITRSLYRAPTPG